MVQTKDWCITQAEEMVLLKAEKMGKNPTNPENT